jgi:cell wall assembly regulator SMI1
MLEDRWRQVGAPVAVALRPGLSDEEMDALTTQLGLRLPDEARRWWRWHDGATARPGFEPEVLGPIGSFIPLAHAVGSTESTREIMRQAWEADDLEEGELGPDWKPSWLKLINCERPIVIDCSVAPEDPVPVRSFFQEPTVGEEGLRSLGELVRIWIDAYDSGAWAYDRTERRWSSDRSKLDSAIAQLHLT